MLFRSYQCNITVGDVANATRPEETASANLTALASGAIALQGYAVSSLAGGAEIQFQSYPAESVFGRPHNGDVTSMAGLVSRFSIGALAAIAETNKPLRVMGMAPESGTVLDITHREYVLLILQGLGLQTSTSSSTYFQGATTRFIPTTSIQDIFIHEAFIGFEVRFYLAIVVRGEEDVVVVFPTLLPRRDILEKVWRGAKACLYEHAGSHKVVQG